MIICSRCWRAWSATSASPVPSISGRVSRPALRLQPPKGWRPQRCGARPVHRDHETAVARTCDLAVVLPTLLGKIEFEMGEEGRERAVLEHLLRLAVAATFRDRLSGLDLSGFTEVFAQGGLVETGDLVAASDLLVAAGRSARVCTRCCPDLVTTMRLAAARLPPLPSSPRGVAPDSSDREGDRQRAGDLRSSLTGSDHGFR